TAISHTVHGNFSRTKTRVVFSACNTTLQLLKVGPSSGRVSLLLASDIFGVIHLLAAFRLPGTSK
ncbi:hypothetical protein BC830DRAFT_1052752, partial [Chytriomyces sp. MP71]